MKKSALQIARAAYQPKLPKALKGSLKIQEGAPTQSVADQDAIAKLFPNTYGMPVLSFIESNEVKNYPAINAGVILSGGQAPGGHNVIAGLFDGLKALKQRLPFIRIFIRTGRSSRSQIYRIDPRYYR